MPTVLDRMDPTMRMMREETFGPVAPMMSFSTDEEALKLANDSRYGLAAYVFTGDMTRGLWLAERLEAGSVGVNTTSPIVFGAPFARVEGERLRKGAVAERLIRVHGDKAHPDRPWGGDLRVRRRGRRRGSGPRTGGSQGNLSVNIGSDVGEAAPGPAFKT
jgi:hypothetical protein